MDKRKEFYNLLCEMQVMNTETETSAREKYYLIQKWLLENIPTKLYRYFSDADRNIEALANNEIWGSCIDTFNDPYETVPCFNMQRIIDSIDHELLIQQSKQISDKIRSYSEEQILNFLTLGRQWLIDYMEGSALEFISEAYARIHIAELHRHIACFTENMNSTLMWGHYASSHRGFCAEYNLTAISKACTENCTNIGSCGNFMLNYPVAPVYYGSERVDATSFLATIIQQNLISTNNILMQPLQDMLIAIKCLLVKSEDWKYEKEWRLLSSSSEIKEKYKVIAYLKPKAVYIGINASKDYSEKIYDICKQQDIPCYKMLHSYFTSDFSLDYIPYCEYINTYHTLTERTSI